MTGLTALAAEIHGDNIRAGWWKQNDGVTVPRNIGEMLCLVHSEISEADEGYCDDLMDDKLPHRKMFEVELADAAIRVLDILGYYGTDLSGDVAASSLPPTMIPGGLLRWMHRTVSTAMEGFRKGNVEKGTDALVMLLRGIFHAETVLKIDVTGAIAEKREFNRNRADHKPENRAAAGGKQF